MRSNPSRATSNMDTNSHINTTKRPTKLVHYDTLMSKLPKDTAKARIEIASIETQAPVSKRGRPRQQQRQKRTNKGEHNNKPAVAPTTWEGCQDEDADRLRLINQALIKRAKERVKILARKKDAMSIMTGSAGTAAVQQLDYDLLAHGCHDMDRVGIIPRPIKRHCLNINGIDLSNVQVISSEEYDALHDPNSNGHNTNINRTLTSCTNSTSVNNNNSGEREQQQQEKQTHHHQHNGVCNDNPLIHDLSTKYGMAYSALVGTTKLMYKDTSISRSNSNANSTTNTTNSSSNSSKGCSASSITSGNSGSAPGAGGTAAIVCHGNVSSNDGALSSLSSSEVDYCDSNSDRSGSDEKYEDQEHDFSSSQSCNSSEESSSNNNTNVDASGCTTAAAVSGSSPVLCNNNNHNNRMSNSMRTTTPYNHACSPIPAQQQHTNTLARVPTRQITNPNTASTPPKKFSSNNKVNLLNCCDTSTMTIEQAMAFSTKARVIVKSAHPNLVVHTNAAFASVTGTSAHRAIGRPFSNLLVAKKNKNKNKNEQMTMNNKNTSASVAPSTVSLEDFISHKIVVPPLSSFVSSQTSAASSMVSSSFGEHDTTQHQQQRINVLDVATTKKLGNNENGNNDDEEESSIRCRVSASLVVAGQSELKMGKQRNALLTVDEAQRVKNITHFILELDELLEDDTGFEVSKAHPGVNDVARHIPMFTVG